MCFQYRFVLVEKGRTVILIYSNMRQCKYRNCKEEIQGRPNKKFCNRKCKGNELKYKQRTKKKIEKDDTDRNNKN